MSATEPPIGGLTGWRERTRRLSPYLLAGLEQALWSVMNVGVGLLLIRLATPTQYGAFVFWSNCAFVLSSLQNALTVTHPLVLPPGDGQEGARRAVERLMFGVTLLFLLVVAASVFALVSALHRHDDAIAVRAAALFIPAFLLQQYVRALAFSRGQPGVAAVQTGLVLALAVVLLTSAALRVRPLTAEWMLAPMGAAYGVVGIGGLVRACPDLSFPTWAELRRYGAYARDSAWIFLGVSSTELLARFYAFVVTGWYGPAALAALSATQLTLRPVPLLATSWSMVGRSDLSRRREAGDWSGFAKVVALALALGAVIAAAWTGVIFSGWSFIASRVFGGKYAGARWMVLLWGISSAISFGQVTVGVALQTLRAFKPLAVVNTIASLCAAAAILVWLRAWPQGGAIAGTAAGQMVELVVMTGLLVVFVRGRRTGRSGPTPDTSDPHPPPPG